jgi:drug/metabolite transporter (DMT)-like permease
LDKIKIETENDEIEIDMIKKSPKAPKWIFMIPAIFDLISTTLSNIGLVYIQASIYQMLSGSILIFSCINSVIFLKDKRLFFLKNLNLKKI